MNERAHIVSVALTAAFLAGAIAIGGGVPPSPAQIARSTGRAADNAATAVDNTESAIRDTRALERIAAAVRAQVDASRRMLDIQLGIEESTRRGAEETSGLQKKLASVTASLQRLRDQLADLGDFSADTARSSEASVVAATELDRAVGVLKARFDEVVRQSRRLDRKARGYRNLRRGAP